MDTKKIYLSALFCGLQICAFSQTGDGLIYKTDTYSIFSNRVEQANFKALAISPVEMSSNCQSPDADKYSPNITFKFSINLRDNEMVPGQDHQVTLQPENGRCATTVQFGKQFIRTVPVADKTNLAPNTHWTIRLDMREVLKAFKEKGFYENMNGEINQAMLDAVDICKIR